MVESLARACADQAGIRADGPVPAALLAIAAESADPWGNPYRVTLDADGLTTRVTVISSGPDGSFDTEDDLAASVPASN